METEMRISYRNKGLGGYKKDVVKINKANVDRKNRQSEGKGEV